jgi:uncharacterized membrane protein
MVGANSWVAIPHVSFVRSHHRRRSWGVAIVGFAVLVYAMGVHATVLGVVALTAAVIAARAGRRRIGGLLQIDARELRIGGTPVARRAEIDGGRICVESGAVLVELHSTRWWTRPIRLRVRDLTAGELVLSTLALEPSPSAPLAVADDCREVIARLRELHPMVFRTPRGDFDPRARVDEERDGGS